MSVDPWGGGSDSDPKLRVKENRAREQRRKGTPYHQKKSSPNKASETKLAGKNILIWLAIVGAIWAAIALLSK